MLSNTLKREHNFSKIIKFNKLSAEKSGSTMSSTTYDKNR